MNNSISKYNATNQKYAREGYWRLNKSGLDDDTFNKLSDDEIANYIRAGKSHEILSRVLTFSVIAILIIGYVIWAYIARTNGDEDYAHIKDVDACSVSLDAEYLALMIDDSLYIVPDEPETDYRENSAICFYLLRGVRSDMMYEFTVMTIIEKELAKQKHDNEVDINIAYDDDYDDRLITYSNQQDYYRYRVVIGVEKTDYDDEFTDLSAELIARLKGITIKKNLPSNDQPAVQ